MVEAKEAVARYMMLSYGFAPRPRPRPHLAASRPHVGARFAYGDSLASSAFAVVRLWRGPSWWPEDKRVAGLGI